IWLAIILNLLHAIRLSARGRQEEIYQLRLLGAGKWFLSIPFIAEGFIYTLISSVLSWVIVIYANGKLSFRNIIIVLPQQTELIYFCIIAMVIGIIAGIIGIRRSL
ncbi:MAG: FtsX-like permease family protein, partial [Candidatus Zixiibacteriota bacterium]